MSEDSPTTTYPQTDIEDGESSIGDMESHSSSDDISVISEAMDYIEENGRFYHANWTDGLYLLPNDEREQTRLEMQHVFLLKVDGLHKAPLPEGLHRVLDVGTGTGEWPIAFVEKFASAVVTAVDMSPIVMPGETHPNCRFFVDDVEKGLGGQNEFDFINSRLLHGLRDLNRFIKHAFEALMPGGYIEMKEFDFPLQFHDPDKARNSALMTWSTNVVEGALKLGIDLILADKISASLRDGGFENVEESISVWPIGTWPEKNKKKVLGTELKEYWLETLEAFSWRPFREMNWRKEETQCLLAMARAEIYSETIRASMGIRTFWARKPAWSVHC
jgi:SAM-dependent methyltransferase